VIDKNLCGRFRKVRSKKGLTQAKLAEVLDVSRSLIAQIDKYHAEPSKEIIIKIVMKLNINANWLLTGDGDMFLNNSNDSEYYKEKIRYLKEKLALLSVKIIEDANEINEIVRE
jgi:transcriptional regulator with XRE-family HTH domain